MLAKGMIWSFDRVMKAKMKLGALVLQATRKVLSEFSWRSEEIHDQGVHSLSHE